jgi:hypothetical protein
MYDAGMKPKSRKKNEEPMQLNDVAMASPSMIRTQIYLTREEHQFLQTESERIGAPMAAIIRSMIDRRMSVPENAWDQNPLLEPTLEDPNYPGYEDASLNHEHYSYGAPKQYEKRGGKWVPLALES